MVLRCNTQAIIALMSLSNYPRFTARLHSVLDTLVQRCPTGRQPAERIRSESESEGKVLIVLEPHTGLIQIWFCASVSSLWILFTSSYIPVGFVLEN